LSIQFLSARALSIGIHKLIKFFAKFNLTSNNGISIPPAIRGQNIINASLAP
jgi:hypothetical protein